MAISLVVLHWETYAQRMRADIIILNGTSSAGKSTLAAALRPMLPATFNYFASDQLADAGFRPLDPNARSKSRDAFFAGFHRSIAAFASTGNDLLIEHIIERQSWADELTALLQPFDVYWVGVFAPLGELERREKLRGNRMIGEAMFHLRTHEYCRYDIAVETTGPMEGVAKQVIQAWHSRVR